MIPRSESSTGKPPLRIGLLLDSLILRRFSAEIVNQIKASRWAHLELLILNDDPSATRTKPPHPRRPGTNLVSMLRNRNRRRELLFGLYQRWDQRHLGDSEDPLAPVDCSALLRDVPSTVVTPEGERFVHRFPPEAIARIRAAELDVLIRFGFKILRGDILQAARFGVWSYHHGDSERYRGGPACFWEVYEKSPVSGAVLQVLNEVLDGGTVLSRCVVATEQGLSMVRNRPRPYWGANGFMIQKLHELHEHGWDYVRARAVPEQPYVGSKPIYRIPTNWEMVRWLAPTIAGKVVRRITKPSRIPHWRIAIRCGHDSLLDQGSAPDLRGFRWIDSPAGHFYADPFLLEQAGKTWLIFEDFEYATKRGRIAAAEVGSDGGLGEPFQVLSRPYHVSYPCIFRDGDELFMIPETGGRDTIELYRCLEFPSRWTLEKELFRERAVDTTVWIEQGTYWFFVTLVEPRARATQLWLFSAKSVTGRWTPHPANPISTDVRNSRGAGALFRHRDRLIRPSQDCSSRRQGRCFTLNEILALTPERYEERPRLTIGATKGFVGTHTYARAGRFEVIDGSTLVRSTGLSRQPPSRYGAAWLAHEHHHRS